MDKLNFGLSKLAAVNPAFGAILSKTSFGEKDQFGSTSSSPFYLWNIFSIIIIIIAFYLAFKCKDTPNYNLVLNILGACCCSPCYIAYRLAFPCV